MASVQAAIEKTVIQTAKVIEDELDAEMDKLEHLDSDELDRLRDKRVQQMKKMASQKDDWRSKGHGVYTEVSEEKDFFDVCKKSEKVVCHFYRESTFRCKIVDKHFELLAPKHLETRFVKLSVDRAHFLCDRLHIRILPTIACVVDGKTKDYIKGFDDLGGNDEFSTEMLAWRLGCVGVINYSGNLLEPPDAGKPVKKQVTYHSKKTIRGSTQDSDSDD